MDEKDFVLAGDGWVQVTPCGEYPLEAGLSALRFGDRHRVPVLGRIRFSHTPVPGVALAKSEPQIHIHKPQLPPLAPVAQIGRVPFCLHSPFCY